MVAKTVKWALASLVFFPPAVFALGLGDVRLLSALNAPLDAEIELVGATPEEMSSLKAQLASRDTFARYGLDWPNQVGNITLTPQTRGDGREIIRMRSTQPITDPFLTLLVEVNWARGRVVREYTMLLDPPVFAPGDQENAPVVAANTGSGSRGGEIARSQAASPRASEPSSGSASPDRSLASPAPTSTFEDSSRTVQRGETLSGIANEVAQDAQERRAWMLAIYQNNPSAFDGNMNILRSGSVLRIPDRDSVAAISPGEARAEIRRQWDSWRGTRLAAAGGPDDEPGRLRLVPPSEGGGSSASGAQNEALQDRVRVLEAQLQESRRLLEARDAELARLQSRLSGPSAGAAAPPPPEPEAEPPVASATPPSDIAEPSEQLPSPPAEEPLAAADEPVSEEPPPAEEPLTAAADTPPPAEESGGSILDTLREYWWAIAGLAVILLGVFGVKMMRSRKQNEFDDSLSRLAASGADSISDRDFGNDTQPLRPGRENAFLVEESGSHQQPRFDDEAPVAAPRNVASDETISSETAINLDQGDPLAEADFHMAYGLYDQAADLVRIAIQREPDRRDLKLKLLEVFFVWGNKDQFLQTARELDQTRDRAAPGEWEKIVIMGKQLAPEDPLFAGGGAGGGSLGGMDLDLEGGQDRVDFDILGDPVAPSGEGGIDLDISSALGESEGHATDSNLALHEDGYTSDDAGTGITREMTQNLRGDNSPTVQSYGADFEAPTVEQPRLGSGDNPTIRQKVESAMRHGGSAEQTAELAIDDLGLDLSALDEHGDQDLDGPGSTQETPTLVAGLDERSRRIIDEAERRGTHRDDLDATAIASTGAWNLNGEDMDQTMPPQHASGYTNGDASETSRLQSLRGSDLDFNFNEADSGNGRVTNGSGVSVDLDVGANTLSDTAFTSTQKLSSEDLALPDMEPVTMSEVGTKLDLARAYMDMGDPEGARNILEEVMTEGSLAQKQEAQRLIESLPG